MSASAVAPRQLVTFQLGAEEFAVDIAQVQEIVRPTAITAVPRAPAYVEGVLNLRGRIVPVIDLAKRFGQAPAERGKAARIVITDVGGRTVGMLVDAVRDVVRLPAEAIEATPAVLAADARAGLVTGLGKHGERLLIVLDLPAVITPEEAAAELPGG